MTRNCPRSGANVARGNHALSILILDVDFFKSFNDTYGHQGGDHCLQRIGSCIADVMRTEQDVIARIGGEEFAAILPRASATVASGVAERIRGEIEKLEIPHVESTVSRFTTVSVGTATVMGQAGLSPERLVEAADRALYEAKAAGRNRAIAAKSITQ